MEWKDKFNSFNSDKVYLHSERLQVIADWLSNKTEILPPPLEVSFDPIHSCNLMCQHCNAHRYLSEGVRRMTDEHIIDLIDYLGKWGVKAACFGGGGESTLHTKLQEAIELAYSYGMDNSLVTNGTVLNDELIDTLVRCCRYVGVSIDSATRDTFCIGRRVDLFDKVIENTRKLAEAAKGTKCDVAYKFLIFGYNQHEIFKACQLAKELGVRDFHARPADFRHQGMGELKRKYNEYDVAFINDEFAKCHSIEDDNFRVFTVTHKFNSDFTPKRPFTQCYASPLVMQICADGNIYFCPDTRFINFYRLGSHIKLNDIKEAWGSYWHRELISKVGCENCTSRCTYSPYNEICERLFINTDDPMIRNLI